MCFCVAEISGAVITTTARLYHTISLIAYLYFSLFLGESSDIDIASGVIFDKIEYIEDSLHSWEFSKIII